MLFQSHQALKALSHTRENIACAKCARCGVLFTTTVVCVGIAIFRKRNHCKLNKEIEKVHSIYAEFHSSHLEDDHHELEDNDQELGDGH